MSNKSEENLNQIVITSLEEDGAVCNYFSKSYDEEKTYEGGLGNRLAFTNYNNKIVAYHTIIKNLQGEFRSNISEAIPAIDFYTPSNTSLLYTYPINKNNNTLEIDPTTLVSIEFDNEYSNTEKRLLNMNKYIEGNDDSILNKALMGSELACHFYNSNKDNVPEPNVQVSYWDKGYSYIYEGQKTPPGLVYVSYLGSEEPVSTEKSGTILSDIYLVTPDSSTGTIFICFDDASSYNGNRKGEKDSFAEKYGVSVSIPKPKETEDGYFFRSRDTSVGGTTLDYFNSSLEVAPNDIALVIQKTESSSTPNKLLLLRYNAENNVYKPYILFADSFSIMGDYKTFKPEDEFKVDEFYLEKEDILPVFSAYLNFRKEYYSSASGLLNGLFCYPKDYTFDTYGSEVSKWVLDTEDLEEANSKGVSIAVGSKYFSGHLMGRGSFLDSPLKLTENDILSARNEGLNLSKYKGKASLIYDLVESKIMNSLTDYMMPISSWSSSAPFRITSVVSKAEYCGMRGLGNFEYENLMGIKRNDSSTDLVSKMVWADKLVLEDDSINSYELIHNIIDSCLYTSNGNRIEGETIYFNLGVDHLSYCIKDRISKTVFDIGYNTSTTKDTGNRIYSDYRINYYLEIYRRYCKRLRKWFKSETYLERYLDEVKIKLASPIDIFRKNGESNDLILIYPEFNKNFPKEIFLISRTNLGLEAHEDNCNTKGKKCSVSLFNERYNRFITFKVTKVYEYLPSKIKFVHIDVPSTLGIKDAQYSGTYTTTQFRRPITDENNEPTGNESVDYSYDCYIYSLENIDLEIGNIKIFNQEDKEVSLSNVDVRAIPLAYPKDYFSTNIRRTPNNEEEFEVKKENRAKDITYLKDSLLLYGLPEVSSNNGNVNKSSISQIRSLHNGRYSIFADFYENGLNALIGNFLNQSIKTLLLNWKITDGGDNISGIKNPISLSNFSDVVEGLVEMKPYLEKVVKSNFAIPLYNNSTNKIEERVLEDRDVSRLFNRINNKDTSYRKYVFNSVSVDKNSNWAVKKIDSSNSSVKNYYVRGFIKSNVFVNIDNYRDVHYYSRSGNTFSEISDSITKGSNNTSFKNNYSSGEYYLGYSKQKSVEHLKPVDTISQLIDRRISKCIYVDTSKEEGVNPRPSLTEVKNVLKDTISEDTRYISKENCEVLDSYFGDNTRGLINFGNVDTIGTPDDFIEENNYTHTYVNENNETIREENVSNSLLEEISFPVYNILYESDRDWKDAINNYTKEASVFKYDSINNIKETLRRAYIDTKAEEIKIKVKEETDNWVKEKVDPVFNAYIKAGNDYNAEIQDIHNRYNLSLYWSNSNTTSTIDNLLYSIYNKNRVNFFVRALSVIDIWWWKFRRSGFGGWKDYYSLPRTDVNYYKHNLVMDNLNDLINSDRSSRLSSVESISSRLSRENKASYDKLVDFLKSSGYISNYSSFFSNIITSIFLDTMLPLITSIRNKLYENKYNETLNKELKEMDMNAFLESSAVFEYDNVLNDVKENDYIHLEYMTPGEVSNFMFSNSNNNFEVSESMYEAPIGIYDYLKLNLKVPAYNVSFSSYVPSKEIKEYLVHGNQEQPEERYAYDENWKLSKPLPPMNEKYVYCLAKTVDVDPDVLMGIKDYCKTALEGTNTTEDQSNTTFIKYVEGFDKVMGRSNSLYYKRYNMLNNRINRLEGPLYKAALYLKNKKYVKQLDNYNDGVIESYEDIMEVIPIESFEELTYLKAQEATETTIAIDGKFYYSEQMEALRSAISTKCVLTCNRCEVKDSCPFYKEDEIIKLYCDEADYIQLWFKDNKPDLIYYEEPPVLVNENGVSLDASKLKNYNKPWADVKEKRTKNHEVEEVETYDIRNLEDFRDELKKNFPTFKTDSPDDLGWLSHARWGTIQENKMVNLRSSTYDYSNLQKYKYLYDAVYLTDEETYINYEPSNLRYDVSVSVGEQGNKTTYTGTTKIWIPSSLKLIDKASLDDDIYLVSDDELESNGEVIVPVVYICKKRNFKYAFDLRNTPRGEGVTRSNSKQLKAQDVAQWSINVFKGTCYEDPIYSNNSYNNLDQYWMDTIYKEVYDENLGVYKYIELEGRKKMSSTRGGDALVDPNNIDDSSVLSGKPMISNYVNFVRKMMIRLDCVEWVNSQDRSGDLSIQVEKIKAMLPLMKTNLRLVIVKNN